MKPTDLFTQVPPQHYRNIYELGDWISYNTWLAITGGIPENFVKVYYIVFSTRFLKYGSTDWDIFSIAVIQYDNTLVLKDFHHLTEYKYEPNVFDMTTLSHMNDYLYGKPPENIYYFSHIENHKQLTNRIIDLITGDDETNKSQRDKPISYYQDMEG